MTSEKRVYYDPSFSTAGRRLLYVYSVAVESGILGLPVPPALPGTIVIDLDNETVLGLIKDKYVVDIAPDGNEFYTTDRAAISTATHSQLRSLPFSVAYPGQRFPRLARRHASVLTVRAARRRDEHPPGNLPISIVSGCQLGHWTRGGPGMSADGKRIYCGTPMQVIDTETNRR